MIVESLLLGIIFVFPAVFSEDTPAVDRFKHIDELLRNKSICRSPSEYTGVIPKILFQTFFQTQWLPKKVHNNTQKFAPGYDWKLYDNAHLHGFIKHYFPRDVADGVHKLKGAHRADVFRYAALYIFGGVYLDIKTEMIMPLKWVFMRPNTTYTAIGLAGGSCTYQGVIASPPCNPIFLHLIRNMINYAQRDAKRLANLDHLYSPRHMYSLIAAMVGSTKLTPQYYPNKFNISALNATVYGNGTVDGIGRADRYQRGHFLELLSDERDRPKELSYFNYELFIERDDHADACWDGLDRYNLCSFIHADKQSWAESAGKCSGPGCTERVFKTRYADYPRAFGM
jgi:Glycosyltransferase sugar-binding region containing DXD motif